MAEKWLSIVEYARAFDVSDMTVRRRIKCGKLHAVLKEGKYFIPVPLDQAVGQHTSSSGRAGSSYTQPVPSRDLSVVKSTPHTVTSRRSEPPVQVRVAEREVTTSKDLEHFRRIPAHIATGLANGDSAAVDATELLRFCEAALKKFNELERRQVERFKSKLEALESKVSLLSHENIRLKQDLEDMGVLLKAMESRRS